MNTSIPKALAASLLLLGSLGTLSAAPEVKVGLGLSGLTFAQFSDDGTLLLAGGTTSSRLVLWPDGRELRSFSHSQGRHNAVLSGDGKFVAVVAGDSVVLRDAATGEAVKTFPKAYSPSFSADSRFLAFASGGGKAATIYELGSPRNPDELGPFTMDDERQLITKVVLSPDARSLYLSISASNKYWRVNVASGKVVQKVTTKDRFMGMAMLDDFRISPQGDRVLTTTNTYATLGADMKTSVDLWNADTGARLQNLSEYSGAGAWSLGFSRDGQWIVAGGKDGLIEVWDLSKKRRTATLAAGGLGFLPQSNQVLVQLGRALSVLDPVLNTTRPLTGPSGSALRQVKESAGGLLVATDGGQLLTWPVSAARAAEASPVAFGAPAFTVEGIFGGAGAFPVSPDGRWVVSAVGSSLKVLDRLTGKPVGEQKVSQLWQNRFSPDSRFLAFCDLQGGTSIVSKLWYFETGKVVSLPGMALYGPFVLSPDGQSVISTGGFAQKPIIGLAQYSTSTGQLQGSVASEGSSPLAAVTPQTILAFTQNGAHDKEFLLIDANSGKTLGRIGRDESSVITPTLALSPDSRRLAWAGEDNAIHVVDLASGKETAVLRGHLDKVTSMAFLSDSVTLASVSSDGTLRTWDLVKARLLITRAGDGQGNWVAWTSDGYFDGTDWAIQNLVYMVDGLKTYGIDQFFEQYHRPDIIAARLKGQDTAGLATADLTKGFAKPPTVALSFPSGPGPVNGQLTVRVTATDQGGGIDGVRLFAAGKAVGEDVRGVVAVGGSANVFTKDFIVSLVAGDNLLRAVGFSRDRTESTPFETTVSYKPVQVVKPNLYVVAAGADTYRNPKYKLNFALADVQGFVEALQPVAAKVFAQVKVTQVLEKDLTRANLVAALDAIKGQAQPQDVFLFFYAGHGIAVQQDKQTVFYFVLPGVTVMNDEEKLRAEGFSAAELRQSVGSIAANKQMLLVDACNSGAFLEGYAVRGAAEENALAQLQRSSGMALFSASTDQQFANEVKDLGHGLFTWALMQGLKGEAATKEGKITASSLKTYIDDAVPVLAQKYRGSEQFPLAKVTGQDFPVGVR